MSSSKLARTHKVTTRVGPPTKNKHIPSSLVSMKWVKSNAQRRKNTTETRVGPGPVTERWLLKEEKTLGNHFKKE